MKVSTSEYQKEAGSNFFQHFCLVAGTWLLFVNLAFGETNHKNPVFKATASVSSINGQTKSVLDHAFLAYEMYRFDAGTLNAFARQNKGEFTIQLEFGGKYSISANIQANDVFAPGARLREGSNLGIKTIPLPEVITYAGKVIGKESNSEVRLSIHDGIFSGLITTDDLQFSIEPLKNFEPSASNNLYVVYEVKNINRSSGAMCEVAQAEQYRTSNIQKKQNTTMESSAACGMFLIGVATDYTMFQALGGSSQVQNKIATLFNLMGAYYTFADIKFAINDFFIETTAANTWAYGSTTDFYVVLPAFTSWASSNFKKPCHLSVLFIDRDLCGVNGCATAGVAPVGTLCTDQACAILDGGASSDNVYTAQRWGHEFGHIFGCNHEGSIPCMMNAYSASGINNWSFSACPTAANTIMNAKANASCMMACTVGPVPAFSSDKTTSCSSTLTVKFQDLSALAPTSWLWDFGDGGTSTLQNPSHTYGTVGTFTVKLTVSNSLGSNTVTANNYITLGTGGLNPTQKIGPASQAVGTGAGVPSGNTFRGMLFKVNKKITINSVRVFTGDTAGKRQFAIIDTSNIYGNPTTPYFDTIIDLPARSDMYITFKNCQLNPGNYLLVVPPTNKKDGIVQNLLRNTGGLKYPYAINGLISIYNNLAAYTGKTTPVEWYAGYDWEIQDLTCVDVSSSVQDIKNKNNLFITPNLSNGLFTIHFSDEKEEKASVEIYNLVGEKVYSITTVLGNNKTQTIDLTDKANGIYIVKVISGDHQMVQRIMKE